MKKHGMCYAVPRETGLLEYDKGIMLAIDTYKDGPLCMKRFERMNPFYYNAENKIPVPGQAGLTAQSVESVWQGLKIVDGLTEFAMFGQAPWKRPPDNERGDGYKYEESVFLYGNLTLNLLLARFLIYLPAYLYVLHNVVEDNIIDEINTALDEGRDVCFYDWDCNMLINDIKSSFSHSAILASFFNGNLKPDYLDEMTNYNDSH